MDGFSYNNIFDTKGLEYIIIISFLLLIIPFWIFINRKSEISRKIEKAVGVLSSGILRIPLGLFYSKYHTWAHLEKSGLASVGLDDLLLHLTGEVNVENLKEPGTFIRKGEILADIEQNGKLLRICSPVSGEIVKTNNLLHTDQGLLNEDPYGSGWVYKIKPSSWVAETDSYFLAEAAVEWSKNELERFKDFLAISLNKHSPGTSSLILQDGGELCDNPLSELPEQIWQDFQKSFLN